VALPPLQLALPVLWCTEWLKERGLPVPYRRSQLSRAGSHGPPLYLMYHHMLKTTRHRTLRVASLRRRGLRPLRSGLRHGDGLPPRRIHVMRQITVWRVTQRIEGRLRTSTEGTASAFLVRLTMGEWRGHPLKAATVRQVRRRCRRLPLLSAVLPQEACQDLLRPWWKGLPQRHFDGPPLHRHWRCWCPRRRPWRRRRRRSCSR